MKMCSGCGQIQGIELYDEALWTMYNRVDLRGRQYIEPLAYTQSDFEDMGYHSMYDMDEESVDSIKMSMEHNMIDRGLCPECGRPDLRGVDSEDIMSEEDAKDMHDMYAEMAAERRMGA